MEATNLIEAVVRIDHVVDTAAFQRQIWLAWTTSIPSVGNKQPNPGKLRMAEIESRNEGSPESEICCACIMQLYRYRAACRSPLLVVSLLGCLNHENLEAIHRAAW